MILLIPINGVLANATKKLQIKQMKYKDKRVKMMNEILSGMKVKNFYLFDLTFVCFMSTKRNFSTGFEALCLGTFVSVERRGYSKRWDQST